MPRDSARAQRVGDQIQRELSVLLAREVSDPRVIDVVINEVEMSADLAHAKIFVSPGFGADAVQAMAGLEAATPYLRRLLAPRLRLRSMPTLRFIHDDSLDNAERIEALLAQHQSSGDKSSDGNEE